MKTQSQEDEAIMLTLLKLWGPVRLMDALERSVMSHADPTAAEHSSTLISYSLMRKLEEVDMSDLG